MNYELKFMSRCLQLARIGNSYVAPNPMVGAVLVCEDVIIGEGYHHRYGEAHAEPNAINSVKDKELLKKSTLYVNLEPCSHYGKTPPCADLIVRSGIPRVVIGTLDPNPKVAGRGADILRNAGIEVETGVLEEECRELNKRFFIYQEQKRPYILLKWAQTKDGFIDRIRSDVSETPLIISNEITKQLTHKMRAENQSILVGANTVLLDNPSLTVRNWSGKSPVRIGIDRLGRIPDSFNLLDGSVPTLIFTENERANKPNLEFIQLNFEKNRLKTILKKIYERNINSVLVEGGATILKSFLEEGLWDEANVEISPRTIQEGIQAPDLHHYPVLEKKFEKHDWLIYKNPNEINL
ncbi:MAG: bifunctional diaminohydroxyphosphoribosylaminopyrimidine deaminase/5-amino-6-(5-phosphoribosylamino)uracil reductase RibD [Paludibacter sp.]|nr:bifunctional diaminohydroxyphosphoribosylaminopyrimidine deaminase/5-amino-6-(5-phosphoribosylamino)uracil reductase RibD [Paludibacter sp.]